MKPDIREIEEAFTRRVQVYKDSMRFSRLEKSSIRRVFYGLQHFGIPYIFFHLAKRRTPLFGDTNATLFFGREITVPISDIGSHVLSMYGIIPHKSERRLTLWMLKNITAHDVFYDVGGHLGFYTALADYMGARAHTFDANGKLCEYLKKNFKNVTYTAVASSKGEVDFFDATKTSDSSASSRFNISGAQTHMRVPATTLDAYAETHTVPTVIKFDIEGGEYDAILGALCLLEKHKPRIVLEVWGGEMGKTYSDGAVKKLHALGYSAYSIKGDGTLSVSPIPDPVSSIDTIEGEGRDNFVFVHRMI